MEIWFRENVETNIEICEKDIWLSRKKPDAYIINVAINNTKLVLYKSLPDGGDLGLKEVLRFIYTEMLNDEYDCEVKIKLELFERRWRQYIASLRNEFTLKTILGVL